MWKRIFWILTSAGGLVMFAAGVGPKDAVSNLSQWYELVTHASAPHWLATKLADKYGYAIATLLFILAISSWLIGDNLQKNGKKNKAISPLQILFDSSNPSRFFWSVETKKLSDDPADEGTYTYREARVEIKNTSINETARNVRVSVEHLHNIPKRPQWARFDREVTDIQPGVSELVPVIQVPYINIKNAPANIPPGTLVGESAWLYGPVRIVQAQIICLQLQEIFILTGCRIKCYLMIMTMLFT